MRPLKLYRRINESFETISNIINNLSQPVIDKLKEGKILDDNNNVNQEKIKSLVTKSHNTFDEVIDLASSLDEEKLLCQLFNQCAFPNKLDLIDEGQNVFDKNLKELGFNRYDNPYLDFVKVYNGKKLSNDDWVILNNIYANSDVDSQTLRGTGVDGKNHIIFNPSLWNQANRDDKLYLIDLWEDLEDKNFTDKLNLNNITNDNIKLVLFKDGDSSKGLSGLPLRNCIIYSNSNAVVKGSEITDLKGKRIRAINDIKKAMLEMQSGTKSQSDIKTKTSKQTKQLIDQNQSRLSSEDATAITKNWIETGKVSKEDL